MKFYKLQRRKLCHSSDTTRLSDDVGDKISLKLLYYYFSPSTYKKQLIATNNTIKKKLIESPNTLEILREANKLDIELYKYVRDELFPERLKKHQVAVNNVVLPESYYKTDRTYKYRTSIAFNKFVYRQLLKVKSVK